MLNFVPTIAFRDEDAIYVLVGFVFKPYNVSFKEKLVRFQFLI